MIYKAIVSILKLRQYRGKKLNKSAANRKFNKNKK